MRTQKILFHGEDVPQGEPEKALFHVIPVPYEKTVSYGGGAGQGPEAILAASAQLELFDGKSIPADFGIFTSPAVDCSGKAADSLANIGKAVTHCLSLNKIPVVLGGEHTVTTPVVESLLKKHGRIGVVHFDAHADLRDSYEGSPWSHACVMKRLFDLDVPLLQLGTRSYSYEEHCFRQEKGICCHDAEDIFRNGVEAVQLPSGFPDCIYVSFDIDCLDPSLIPATGTPVPGGLTWYQVMWLLEKVMKERVCVGFDVVELAPIAGLHGASYAAAQLVYNIMGYLVRSPINRAFWELV